MVDNNGMGYNMNVVPQGYADGGNGGMFGGNWMWFLLVWMAMFGWGNGGFGFGGCNNGGGYVGSEVQRGFDQSAVINGINGIQTGMCNGFAGVNQAVSNGFAQAEIAANSRQMADMNQNFQLQSALQQCCCDNRAATADLKYTMATEAANTRANCDNNNQKILDKLCQLELDGVKQNYENRIAAMQNALDQERANNQSLRFAASQGAQTAQILANNDAQTTALEQYLAPTPRPAYVVQNPNCCAGQFGYGGCGGYAA
jgi:hypothetical protein